MTNTPISIEKIEKVIPILLTDEIKKKINKIISKEKEKSWKEGYGEAIIFYSQTKGDK
jgi:hypothetical protein